MTERPQMLLRGIAELFFLPGVASGLFVLTIAMLQPRIALAGILSVLAAYGAARLVGLEDFFLRASYYIYNPLLVGFALGYQYELNELTALLAILGGVLTFVITMLSAHLLLSRSQLPILSVPFSLTSAIMYLVVARYAQHLTPASAAPAWLDGPGDCPAWLTGFFSSLGMIVLSPHLVVGLLIALLIACTSRILILLAIIGYYTGVLTRCLLQGDWNHWELVFQLKDNFNFILIMMALGGMFFVPSRRSFLVALLATITAPLVLDAFTAIWSPLGVPAYTLPFCLIVATTVYALRLAELPGFFAGLGDTPEEIRENAIVTQQRYPGSVRSVFLPFSGKWTVWQGFNGQWTHQGIWRFAYDFVVTGEDGRTHRGQGNQLTDYLCYRMPVLSPVRGRVVRVVDHLADNPIGSVSGGSNWGNLVIIEDLRGFYVELSHFSPKSIRVKEGDWVERGAPLGLCGNSGNSPQPHIHFQVQATDAIGAGTMPFSFASYRLDDVFHANDLPPVNAQVEPLIIDKSLDELTSFVLDEALVYDVFRRGRPVDHVRLQVKLAPDGTNYFETNRGKLFFGKCDGTFYVYRVEGDDPYLRLLFTALPRLPLAYRHGLKWIDYVPSSVALSGVRAWLCRLGAMVASDLARVEVQHKFIAQRTIESTARIQRWGENVMTRVELDEECGIAAVTQGDLELRRTVAAEGGALVPIAPARPSRQRAYNALAASALIAVSLLGLTGADRNSGEEAKIREAIQQSVTLEKSNSTEQAIAALTQDYSAHRGSYPVNARLGWLSYKSKSYSSAEQYYQIASRLMPKSLESQQGLVLCAAAQEKWPETEAAARKVLSIDSGNYSAKLNLAYSLRMQKKYKEAADALQTLLNSYPTDFYVSQEATALQATQDPAAMALKTGEVFDAKLDEAWQASLQAENSGNYAEAFKALDDVYKTHSKSYQLNARMGWLCYAKADYANSETYYDQAIKVNPAALEAKLGRLSPLIALGKLDQIETQAQAIVRADSLNYSGNFWHAYALRLQGKPKSAAPILERLIGAYPSDANTLLNLGFVRLADNQKALAKDFFNQVLIYDPGNKYATEQLKGL